MSVSYAYSKTVEIFLAFRLIVSDSHTKHVIVEKCMKQLLCKLHISNLSYHSIKARSMYLGFVQFINFSITSMHLLLAHSNLGCSSIWSFKH